MGPRVVAVDVTAMPDPHSQADAEPGSAQRASSADLQVAWGHLKQSADFQRLLATPIRQRSAHFAVHHVNAKPLAASQRRERPLAEKLSTDKAPLADKPVDDFVGGRWLGCVVPKRHAKRSVTRSMLKRQMRAAAQRLGPRLGDGLWLLRLRSPFAVQQYPSADSAALRAAARSELDQLLTRLARPDA